MIGIKIHGSLTFEDSNRKLKQPDEILIIFENWKRSEDNSKLDSIKTDKNGKFDIEINAPSIVDNNIILQAHSIAKIIWNEGIYFTIDVWSSSVNRIIYSTRRHYVLLDISTAMIINTNEKLGKTNFRSGEVITFIVRIKDKDTYKPISGIDTIKIRLTGINQVLKILSPTNEKGETTISIASPNIYAIGWTYQAFYPGNSEYYPGNSETKSYDTSKRS